MKRVILLMGVLCAVIWSCQKDQPANPFIDVDKNQDTVGINIIDPEPTSFAGLYQNIFKPTCANVGCHDGTFEPDFRTMESAYNTMVFEEPIKNDGNYLYRVHPGQLSTSAIVARLDNVLSPPMPIQIEPDSDWEEKSQEYIGHIKAWIANGAKDILGNSPVFGIYRPELAGAEIKFDTSWLKRKNGHIEMPIGIDSVDMYLSFKSDTFPYTALENVSISFSDKMDDFSAAISFDLIEMGTPLKHYGLNYDEIEFTHKITLDPSALFSLDVEQWFYRAYVALPGQNITELPTDNGIFYFKNYMSFVWKD